MDTRGETPKVWADCSDLAELLHDEGPFLTLHLPTPGDQENALRTIMLLGRHSARDWRAWVRPKMCCSQSTT